MSMTFDTKIAVVLREDLAVWQKLNVTAFLVSGIAGTVEGIIGEPYEDGSGNRYLPMIIQPMMVFSAASDQIKDVYDRAMDEGFAMSIFTQDLFATGNDIDNRAAVKARPREQLELVGVAMREKKKPLDRVLKGLSLHK